MGNDKQVFREKSLDQLSEPEQLTEYVRVAGAGVWFLLAGIIILLAGLAVWGVFGNIATTVDTTAKVENKEATVYLLAEDADNAPYPVTIKGK